jgi:hypothetical protein
MRRATSGSKPQALRQRGSLLVPTACFKPPQGRARWTLELLADQLVGLTLATVSRETLRRRLAENDLEPWRKEM